MYLENKRNRNQRKIEYLHENNIFFYIKVVKKGVNIPECGWAGLTRRVQIILSQRKRAHALCHTRGSTTIILRLLIAVQQVGRRRRKELHAASWRGAVAAWLRLMLRLLAEGGGGTAERRDGFVRRLGHASPQDCTMVRNA